MARLSAQPPTRVDTLAELVGIAHTVETEAIRCYSRLADEMLRRGEPATAEAFAAMAREEDAHVAAVEGWAGRLGQPVPADDRFRWRLPVDLAQSWDEVSGSALLTPYRAYAIAVDNEQRAFAFYAYLAAAADDAAIAREAEALAREELRHAALLRTWRRAAWRRERNAAAAPEVEQIASPERLAAVVADAEAGIAACHRLLAVRLRAAGDPAGAALLEALADEAGARAAAPAPGPCAAEECTAGSAVALLLAAQRPLEQLCERLEATFIDAADERLQAAAQDALSRTVSRIARLGRRIEIIEAASGPAD